MKTYILYLAIAAIVLPFSANAATSCSRANLTRCLDSACAINVNANPAARCQYCGTADAGTPSAGNAMRNLTLGQSTKYTFTDKELKNAPTDPGQRYVWATENCIKKLGACTPDDVSDVYDKLIEQSCRAAGINAQMAALRADAARTPTATTCLTDIRACLTGATRCGPDYGACAADADFDKFFAACSVEATGCDEFLGDVRTEMITARDNALKSAETLVESIVASYQSARTQRLNAVNQSCNDNAARDACIAQVCAQNMTNHCGDGVAPEQINKLAEIIKAEKSMALQLCKFYETACATLK